MIELFLLREPLIDIPTDDACLIAAALEDDEISEMDFEDDEDAEMEEADEQPSKKRKA